MELTDIFSKRLRYARTMRGMSMEELSGAMGNLVTKQAISKYEQGKHLPDSGILIALCSALDIKPDFLFRASEEKLHDVQYRKQSKLGKKMLDSIHISVQDKIERIVEIEEISFTQRAFNTDLSDILVENTQDVIKAALKLRREWNIGNDAISNVIDMLENNGVIVVEMDAPSFFSGLNGLMDDRTPVIVVNSNGTSERNRLTALHELGHSLLKFSPNVSEKDMESFCNTFANEVLLPKDVFVSIIGNKRHDISVIELQNLQSQYGISVDALMYKARYLNIITERRHTTYWKKKNFDPGFKHEVECSLFPKERSTKFENMVYRALSNDLISNSKAAELLDMPLENVLHKFVLA